MSVMKALRARRLAAGLTQSEVAEALGIGQTAVSQWEQYGVNPNADKLPQLAKLYGCKIDDLFDDTGAGALTADAGRGRVALAGHARVCARAVRQGQAPGHAGWETVAGGQKGTNADDWR